MDFSGQYKCAECAEVYPFRVSVCPSCGGKCSQIPDSRFEMRGSGNINIGSCAGKSDLVRVVAASLQRLNLNVKSLGNEANCGIDLLCETASCRIGIKILFDSDSCLVGTAEVKDALAGKAILGCESVVIVSTSAFSKAAFDWSNRTGVILRSPDDLKDYLTDKLGLPKFECSTEDVRQDVQSAAQSVLSSETKSTRYAQIKNRLCVRCGRCVETCQRNAIEHDGVRYRIRKNSCTGCGLCVKACFSGAIMIWSSTGSDGSCNPACRILKAPFDGYVELRGNGQSVQVETGDPLFDITWAGIVKTICAPCAGVVIPRVKTRRKYDKDTVICMVVDEAEVSEGRDNEIARYDPKIVRAECSGWIKDIKVSDGTYVHSGRDIVDIDFYGLMKVPATARQKGHVTLSCLKGQFVKFGQEVAELKN